MNKNFVHQVGDQPRLYYDARSTNHQDSLLWFWELSQTQPVAILFYFILEDVN